MAHEHVGGIVDSDLDAVALVRVNVVVCERVALDDDAAAAVERDLVATGANAPFEQIVLRTRLQI